MKHLVLSALVIGVVGATSGIAVAQSPDYMIEDCSHASQQFYQDFQARTEASYEGQRTDGTHAVNGTIYLENRNTYFSCSYNAKGDTLVEFFAEKKSWPDFVHGGGSPYQASGGGASSSPLDDLIGTDAIRAFDVMTERGFTNVDTISGNDEIYGTYWNASTRECVQMNSRSGRVFGIEKVPSHPKCR
jgi:hypothetical protein